MSLTPWYDLIIIIENVWRKKTQKSERKKEREEERKITISCFNTNVLLGESRGLRVHVEALKGPWLSLVSLTEAIWRDYRRFTVFSEGPAGAPWKLLNWEMSESGHRIERRFVSGGAKAHSLTRSTKRTHRGTAIPTCTHSGTLIHTELEAVSPTKADQNLFAGYQSVSAGFNSP